LNADVPETENDTTPNALKRFHQAVIKQPTIDDSKNLLLEALNKFDMIIHWWGTNDKFLRRRSR